jgi:hypothetical protein
MIAAEILFAAGKKIGAESPVSGAKRRKGAQYREIPLRLS